MRTTATLVLAAALLTSGCSAILVRRPPSEPEPIHWPSCTEHRLYPLIDTVYAVLVGTAVVAALGNSKDDLNRLGAGLTIPVVLGFGGSGIYGWVQTSRCARARAAYEEAARQGR